MIIPIPIFVPDSWLEPIAPLSEEELNEPYEEWEYKFDRRWDMIFAVLIFVLFCVGSCTVGTIHG